MRPSLGVLTVVVLLAAPALAESVCVFGPGADGDEADGFARKIRLGLAMELSGCGYDVVLGGLMNAEDAARALEESGDDHAIVGRAWIEGHRGYLDLTCLTGGKEVSHRVELSPYGRLEPRVFLALLEAFGIALPRGRREFLRFDPTRPREALKPLGESARIDPRWAWPWLEMARMKRRLRDAQGSLDALEEALKREADLAEAFNERGILYYMMGRDDESIASLEKAIEIDPSYPEAHLNLSTLLWKHVEMDRALELSRKAIEIKPDYYQAWFNLANCHYIEKRHDEAIEGYLKAIEFHPEFLQARVMLGQSYFEAGRFEDGEKAFRELLKLRSDDLSAHFHLGRILARDEATRDEAIDHYERYLEAGGDDPKVTRWLKELREKAGKK